MSTVMLPFLSFISCSSSSIREDLRISITKKIVTKSIIEQAISDFNTFTEVTLKINALGKLFDGITTENFSKFTVIIDSNLNDPKITLNALVGFAFGTQPSITSRLVFQNLAIEPIPTTLEIVKKAINDYKLAADDNAKIIILQPLFSGIEINIFSKFNVTISQDKFILEAADGYIFGTLLKIESKIKI